MVTMVTKGPVCADVVRGGVLRAGMERPSGARKKGEVAEAPEGKSRSRLLFLLAAQFVSLILSPPHPSLSLSYPVPTPRPASLCTSRLSLFSPCSPLPRPSLSHSDHLLFLYSRPPLSLSLSSEGRKEGSEGGAQGEEEEEQEDGGWTHNGGKGEEEEEEEKITTTTTQSWPGVP